MADGFDLDNPPAMEDESPSARRRRERKASEGRSQDKPASDSRSETDLTGRLNEAFTKLADQLLSKGDEELGNAIKEERNGMSNGLVTVTRTVTFLRNPLVLVLELSFVLLAFWRVGSILLRRMFTWRENVMVERANYEQEQAYRQEHPDAPVGGPIIPDESVITN